MNLQKLRRAQHLKALAATGQIDLPTVDPTDTAALARLSPAELELVQVGLYVAPGNDGPERLPPGWDMAKLRSVQQQRPDDWREVVRSFGGVA